MAQTITRSISIDVAQENRLQPIVAKQYDRASRFLNVQFLDMGTEMTIEQGATIVINAKRSDGHGLSFSGSVNSDGTVRVPITYWMLELDGPVVCDISIITGSSADTMLTSTSFTLEVQAAAVTNADVEENEDYPVLLELIHEVSEFEPELLDIRNGVHGQTYNSAGDAVRANANQLYNMKTGFDGVTYRTPVQMVNSCDQKLQDQIDPLKNISDSIVPFIYAEYYDTANGAMKISDGVFNQALNTSTKKYKIADGVTSVVLHGYCGFDSQYAAVAYMSNGTMIGYIAGSISGLTKKFEEVQLPSGTDEVWLGSGLYIVEYNTSKTKAVINSVDNIYKASPYATITGTLKSDGTIASWPEGIIGKFQIPEGAKYFYMEGEGSYTYAPLTWSYVWIRDENGIIRYINAVYTPQIFNKTRYMNIPEGATEIWMNPLTRFHNIYFILDTDLKVSERLDSLQAQIDSIQPNVNQWQGKTWYCYGTSISNTAAEGKYPTYLAQMSGMIHVNKGISGGGIGNLGGYAQGQVYNAICNTTDGKLNADLITLETGANDVAEAVPLGTIYDTGQTTLAGCLNDCIQYLQANTNAQIAITCSPVSKTATDKYMEWAAMVEEICRVNRVHFLNPDNTMGKAKLNSASGSLYVVDNIHHTNLGGYIMAQNLWYQLRNIPCFYTAIPT